MTTDLEAIRPPGVLATAQADRGAARLRQLLPLLREDEQSRKEAAEILPILSAPARPEWLMARVVSLLNPYFEKETPQAVREMELEDWAEELAQFPEWAVSKAVRWWKGAENEKRGRRPIDGDISARCAVEMDVVLASKRALSRPAVKRVEVPDRPRAELTEKQKQEANAMVAQIGLNKTEGFKPRRETDQEKEYSNGRPEDPSDEYAVRHGNSEEDRRGSKVAEGADTGQRGDGGV